MVRPLRVEMEGGLYHVTSRGDGRENIFLSDGDRTGFLDILGRTVERHHWLCHAYCLMGNHYHLLVETPVANLSRGMRHLNGVYTQRFNAWHDRVGHVFQGRYKAVVVDREAHLLELCRYVVLNPVRAGLVESPGDWPWSSYRVTAGLAAAPPWLTVNWLLGRFGSRCDGAWEGYRAFVREGTTVSSPWEALKGQIFLGDDSFLRRVGKALDGKETLSEIPRAQRLAARPPLGELLSGKAGIRDKRINAAAAHQAFSRFGYTQKEIAEHLGVHPATVSRMIRSREQ